MSNVIPIKGRGTGVWAAIRRPIVRAGITFALGMGAGALVAPPMCSPKPLSPSEQLEERGIFASRYLDAFGKNIRFYNPSALEAADDALMLNEGHAINLFSRILADDTVMDVDEIRFIFKKGTWLEFGGKGQNIVSFGTPRNNIESKYGLILGGYRVYFNLETGKFDNQPKNWDL